MRPPKILFYVGDANTALGDAYAYSGIGSHQSSGKPTAYADAFVLFLKDASLALPSTFNCHLGDRHTFVGHAIQGETLRKRRIDYVGIPQEWMGAVTLSQVLYHSHVDTHPWRSFPSHCSLRMCFYVHRGRTTTLSSA